MPKDIIIAIVGHCIYCGAHGSHVELTAEHIIPYALGGFHVLDKASCIPCRDITAPIEQNVLRSMLGLARVRLGVQTRRKAARTKPFRVEIHEDGRVSIANVPPDELPAYLFLPIFDHPGTPFGQSPKEELPLVAWWASCLDNDPRAMLNDLGRKVESSGHVRLGVLRLDEFARMLAKMAHGMSVARPELGPFRPLLPEVILRKNPDLSLYVGCPDPNSLDPPEQHIVQINVSWADKPFDQWLVADIRLFAMLGGPTYRVIVGQRAV